MVEGYSRRRRKSKTSWTKAGLRLLDPGHREQRGGDNGSKENIPDPSSSVYLARALEL